MPLPKDNMQWPPIEWQETYRLYDEWAAWYSGDPMRLADVHGGAVFTPTPKGRFWAKLQSGERKVMLHVPIAGDIATASADLLFSEAPRIAIPEAQEENNGAAQATQDRLEEIIEEGGLHNRLLEAAETAAALGGVFVKPNWDDSLANFPLLSVVQADSALPEFQWGILRAVTLWREIEREQRDETLTIWRHVERHEVGPDGRGRIRHGLYRGSETDIGTRFDLRSKPQTENLDEEVVLPFQGLGIRYVPNMRPNRRMRGSALGHSDYSGTEGLMDALDEVYTSWQRDIRLGKARVVVNEEWLQLEDTSEGNYLAFDDERELFTKLRMDPQADKHMESYQFAIRMQEHEQTAMNYIERIITSAGYSPQTFGIRIEGRAESGTALRLRERKSFITLAKKQRYWRSPIEDVLWMMLAIDREIFENRQVSTEFRPRVEFADSVQPDPKELAETVRALEQAKSASVRRRVELLNPDWSDAQVEEEVERIRSEEGMAVDDPFQVGMA